MSAQEIIENQMNEMRREIAEANKQIGRIEECLDSMSHIVSSFDTIDGKLVCSTEQYKELMELGISMRNACKRV